MGVSRSYADESYGALSVIQSPIEVDTADGTPGNVCSFVTTEKIEVVEVGIIISEVVANDSTAAVVSCRTGTTDHIELTIVDGTANLTSLKQTGSTVIDAGTTVIFYHKTAGVDAGTQTGKGYMYFKFRELASS